MGDDMLIEEVDADLWWERQGWFTPKRCEGRTLTADQAIERDRALNERHDAQLARDREMYDGD